MPGSKNKIGAQVDGIGAHTDGIGPHVEGAAPYLDRVGAFSASDQWSSAIPQIDFSEIKSLEPEEREILSKQLEEMRNAVIRCVDNKTNDLVNKLDENKESDKKSLLYGALGCWIGVGSLVLTLVLHFFF